MSIKIEKMGLYATPDSSKSIVDWIELHEPSSRTSLFTVMGMTWNFFAEELSAVEEFGGDSAEHLEQDNTVERVKVVLEKLLKQMEDELEKMNAMAVVDTTEHFIRMYEKQKGKHAGLKAAVVILESFSAPKSA